MKTNNPNRDLKQSLAGVYRYGNDFRIFPRPGTPVGVVINHEWMHFVLATSTRAGFLHQILAWLAFQVSSSNATHWEDLYCASIDLALRTHEGTATFTGLAEPAAVLGRQAALLASGIAPEYEQYLEPLDQILPRDLSPTGQIALARAIATYAFDVSMEPLLCLTWGDIGPSSNSSSWLPQVDTRWDRLLSAMTSGFLKNLAEELQSREEAMPMLPNDLSVRAFLAERRNRCSRMHFFLMDRLSAAFSDRIPLADTAPGAFAKDCVRFLEHFRSICAQAGESGLAEFRRDFTDDGNEDPLLYQNIVFLPSQKLDGLVRIPSEEAPPLPADVICVVKNAWDSVLSETLILLKGQFYVRWFREHNGRRLLPTFYSISDAVPSAIWGSGDALIVFGGEDDWLANLPLEHRASHSVIVRWWSHFSRQRMDSILDSAETKAFVVAHWQDPVGVATLFVYDGTHKVMDVASSAGAALDVYLDDFQRNLPENSQWEAECRQLVGRLLPFMRFLHPTEGVPLT